MARDVMIACDFASTKETLDFLDLFTGAKPFVKIGMELFYAEGPEIVRQLKVRGHKIFLDLKLHDIPNTVEKAMRVLGRLGVDMTNVHAAGGKKMMAAALRGLTIGAAESEKSGGATQPTLIAVTQLTSTDSAMLRDELLISKSIEETVTEYAKNAKSAGLDGVVCSPLEAGLIHDACGNDFFAVTPGIRFSDSKSDDQNRITTPEGARTLGSDYIVVGRPITQAVDPVSAYNRCLSEFTGENK